MEQLLQALADAATKLGFEAARIWPQLVMITWLKSLAAAVVYPVAFVASAYGLAHFLHRARKVDSEVDGILALAAGTLTLVFGMAILACYPEVLAGLFFPEAQTVLDLAGKVK